MSGIKEKYAGLQSAAKKDAALLACMGDYACLFLCMCSIADEYNRAHHNGRTVDVVALALRCHAAGYIDGEWTVKNQCAVLELATGVRWKKAIAPALPDPVPEEMYTVEKWYNKRTGYTHFRRRGYDTVENSVTVRDGARECYYTYSWYI